MNREWHEAHPMPSNANLQQRIDWHKAHEQHCGCRETPPNATPQDQAPEPAPRSADR